MAWIVRRADAEVLAASRRARAGYPPEYGAPSDPRLPEAVRGDSIMQTHSQLPQVLEPVFVALRALFDPALPLTRRQHEMIATVVSVANDCFY
jgi:hypothetical protein